jgi:hypothetical protein
MNGAKPERIWGDKKMKNQFKTKAAVIEFLSSLEWLDSHSEGKKFSSNNTYYLSHGEYSRPDYYPARYKDGWAVKVAYFYYPGTFYAPVDGRMSEESFVEKFLVH